MPIQQPRVSVVIPCYKQAQFLFGAIESVLLQTESDVECLIVNDGSPDHTREVAEWWVAKDPRVHYIEQTNKGLSGARNSGLREARGEILQFLDADDLLEPEKLKFHADYLDAHPEFGLVFGDARYFHTENPGIHSFGPYADGRDEPWIPRLWNSPGDLIEKLLERNLFPVNCPLVRRVVFEKVGYWNEMLPALEDWEFWLRCAASNIGMTYQDAPKTRALIRLHEASMTRDPIRIGRAVVTMRISTGPVLKEPHLRRANFEFGLSQLHPLDSPDFVRRLIALMWANFTYEAFAKTASLLSWWSFRWVTRSAGFRKFVPWRLRDRVDRLVTALQRRSL